MMSKPPESTDYVCSCKKRFVEYEKYQACSKTHVFVDKKKDKPKVSENVMNKAERLAQDGVAPYPDGNYQVKGSKPNTSYYVQRLKDGTLSCECIAANNGNRNCAHVIAIGKYEEYQKELKKKKMELEQNPPVEETTKQTVAELEEAEF